MTIRPQDDNFDVIPSASEGSSVAKNLGARHSVALRALPVMLSVAKHPAKREV